MPRVAQLAGTHSKPDEITALVKVVEETKRVQGNLAPVMQKLFRDSRPWVTQK